MLSFFSRFASSFTVHYVRVSTFSYCWNLIRKMRELLFASNGSMSDPNLAGSDKNFGPQNLHATAAKDEGTLQDFVRKLEQSAEHKKPLYSFEISPARAEDQCQHLLESTVDILNRGFALFASVTWHLASPHMKPLPAGWSSLPAVRLACGISKLLQPCDGALGGILLNLSAAGLTECDVTAVLETISKDGNIWALFIVRGDSHSTGGEFEHANDLVRFVRNHRLGKKLRIGVAGYPFGHPESTSYEEDLLHLKEKVEAGADFIISQVTFDAGTFLRFSEDCRSIGIKVPILPGVPIVTSAKMLERLCQLCRISVPQILLSELSSGGAQRGLQWCVTLTQQLITAGVTNVHFFTLNSIGNLREVLRKLADETSCTGTAGLHEPHLPVMRSMEPLSKLSE